MSLSLIAGEPLVAVIRGNEVDAVHSVAGCAVGAGDHRLLAFGTVDRPVYLRSAAKPFIAAVVLLSGAAERFGLDQREIATIAASHNAEAFHLEAVRSILRKIGLSESALQCGPEPPYVDPIYNNCSGKHAGILALCRAIGADTTSYLEAENPAQRRILEFCASMSDQSIGELSLAVDGCGIPAYATTLERAARSYQRLATLDGLDVAAAGALRRVRDAMIAYPESMSGTGEFDAALIRAYRGALVCKGGAEGVLGVALIDRGIGLVIKVIDGNERARPPAAIAVLRELGAMSDEQHAKLAAFARPTLRNKAGRAVGEIRPVNAAR